MEFQAEFGTEEACREYFVRVPLAGWLPLP